MNTCVSFSGGRSSGLMLWRLLQANGGKLPEGHVVCFANTGKERPETLDFVQECSERWDVPITWLEYRNELNGDELEHTFEVVDYPIASRNGEPFATLVKVRKMLPNPVSRFCTAELKVRTMHRYLFSIGWTEWESLVGIRADEQRRIAKLGNQDYGKHEEKRAPLAEDGITKREVSAFWAEQPFDLRLLTVNGKSFWGNCDLCFLKSVYQVASLIAEQPSAADWWSEQERYAASQGAVAGAMFRQDRPNYAAMKHIALTQIDMLRDHDEAIEDCSCVD